MCSVTMGSPRPTLRQILRPARLWIGGLVFCFLAGLWVVTCLYYFELSRSEDNPADTKLTSIQIASGSIEIAHHRTIDRAWVVTRIDPPKWHLNIIKNRAVGFEFDIGRTNTPEEKEFHLLLPLWPVPLLWIAAWFAGCNLLERKRMRHLSFPVEPGGDIG